MIIQLENRIQDIIPAQIETCLSQLKIPFYPVETQKASYLVCTPEGPFDIRLVGHLEGVKDVHIVGDKHKMVNKRWKVEDTVIDLGEGLSIGGDEFAIMAGPCSIDTAENIELTVSKLVEKGIRIMRGGVFKPRTSPYSFMGKGMEGLLEFYSICKAAGIKIITEIMEPSVLEQMYPYVDIFQVGARNSQNFALLEALGKTDKPVMIKRGISGTIDELLFSAEYVFKNGNERLILCERGIRSFESAYRNTLDLNAVPILKERSHLPVIVDPSHGIGIRKHVRQMAVAGAAVGADGVIVEMHPDPDKALTDNKQTIGFDEFGQLVDQVRSVHQVIKGF